MTTVRNEAPPPQAGAASSGRPVLTAVATAYMPVKAAVEWVAALGLLVMSVPVLVILGILLKFTSRGPVLYQQTRLGRAGRHFQIYKLRTMTHGCESISGPVWSIAGDPRVTRVGRWLRDTHLDELPQLWNIVRGDMSLIGPRPERPVIADKIERAMPEFRHRLLVRPGITGLAQMRLPADYDVHIVRRKLAHDVYYISHLGPWLDAMITLSTVLHFVGMAATSASRLLVRSFAPVERSGASAAMLETELPVAGYRIGPAQAITTKDELPWAA